jgi:hypothetical protein
MRTPLLFTFFAASVLSFAQSDLHEVRFRGTPVTVPQETQQARLRAESAWPGFATEHPRWQAVMDAHTGLPHRAYGPGLTYDGMDWEGRLLAFEAELAAFGINADFEWDVHESGAKHDWAFAQQSVEGVPVFGAKVMTKWRDGALVAWGADWYRDATFPEGELLSEQDLLTAAEAGLGLDEWGVPEVHPMVLVPQTTDAGSLAFRLVQPFVVSGRLGALPKRYLTWVDALTGEVLMRTNQVRHIDGRIAMPATADRPERVVRRMGIDRPAAVTISGSVRAEVHAMYPYEAAENLEMPHLALNIPGDNLYTDAQGGFVSSAVGPTNFTLPLTGRWSTVYTNGTTPSGLVALADGYNNLDISTIGNVKERSAYRAVSQIHDHMKLVLPDFDGLDFSLPTNIDVAGECNAFYDGQSVNFYDAGGGCNATSLIADVVWHEYGHAINDFFYQSMGGFFMNGAMGEGYADLWAMSLGDLAEIGKGFNQGSEEGIRRYDQDPKVYPQDLVGEVHADGEIICGAWYDTHLLMGGDWTATMALFADAYPGLQAETVNGDEGQAFTDVLIDVLQADDDDADLSNGTPNAQAIIEGFDLHGITIFGYAEMDHTPVEFADADAGIEIEGDAEIIFPYSLYFDGMKLRYRTAPDANWLELEMVEGASGFTAELPAQPAGTVISYYLYIADDFGGLSAIDPVGAAAEEYPNLPHFTLVGVEPLLINDSDEYSDFGFWQAGVPGYDNATTGQWEEAIPVGSFGVAGDPSTIAAPNVDHSFGLAGFAFVTGVNPAGGSIGANDVDAGHTTLQSPVIDLTPYEEPVIAYWRWYCNAPYSGANPRSDWWQVQLSNDGGASWTYLENTLQQDLSWRRNAFRVADWIEPSDEFVMRFIASDSTTIGEYLDGGSLVEAALDDIVLYDLASGASVEGPDESAAIAVFPNPANEEFTSTGWWATHSVRLINGLGQTVSTSQADGFGQVQIPVANLPVGVYWLVGYDRNGVRRSAPVQLARP